MILLSAGSARPQAAAARVLFESRCARCHGKDGAAGRWGAPNLQRTKLSDQELFTRISEGRRIMPAWKKRLTPPEIRSVIDYIHTLKALPGG